MAEEEEGQGEGLGEDEKEDKITRKRIFKVKTQTARKNNHLQK